VGVKKRFEGGRGWLTNERDEHPSESLKRGGTTLIWGVERGGRPFDRRREKGGGGLKSGGRKAKAARLVGVKESGEKKYATARGFMGVVGRTRLE